MHIISKQNIHYVASYDSREKNSEAGLSMERVCTKHVSLNWASGKS